LTRTQLRLHLSGYFKPFLVLGSLVFWINKLTKLLFKALSFIELIALKLLQHEILLLFVAFISTFVQEGFILFGTRIRWRCLICDGHHSFTQLFVIIFVELKVLKVFVGVQLARKLLSIDFVHHVWDNIDVEVLMRIKGSERLLFFVEHHQEYLMPTHFRKLYRLLDQPSLPFGRGYFSFRQVLNVLWGRSWHTFYMF
jgi:hypothetical protein